MFERFTERARQVVVLAQDEARALKHNYIGTEHLLLGLLREEEGIAARVLGAFDLQLEDVRAGVTQTVGQGQEVATGQIPFTPRAKSVLELSLREALSLGHNHIGTEHILLGLVRDNESVSARILLDLGADANRLRDETIRMLSGSGAPPVPTGPPLPPVPDRPVELEEWPHASTSPRPGRRLRPDRWPVVGGLLVAAAGFPLGLLVGWAIWG